MIAQINHSKLILQENADVQYTFDKTGRLTNIRHGHRYIARGFDGSMIAHTWHRGRHETDPLTDEETRTLLLKSRETLQKARDRHDLFLSDPLSTDDVLPWFEKALSFQPEQDRRTFREIYRPVGILPPDQYAAVVLQVTESCAWNRCSFCSFYKAKPFHLKTFDQFAGHLDDVREFLGEELAARNSVFLGEANAMAAPVDLLVREMDLASDKLVPSMADFRGFYSFLEPGQTPEIGAADWRRLRDAGLRRIYLGLETGCEELRRLLGKTGTAEDVLRAARAAKEAGISVGIILILGVGGRSYFDRHVNDSILALHSVPLDGSDMVFLSPLCVDSATPYSSLAGGWGGCDDRDMERQHSLFQAALPPGARAVIYDIRHFSYA